MFIFSNYISCIIKCYLYLEVFFSHILKSKVAKTQETKINVFILQKENFCSKETNKAVRNKGTDLYKVVDNRKSLKLEIQDEKALERKSIQGKAKTS